jgi:hypothetical protein
MGYRWGIALVAGGLIVAAGPAIAHHAIQVQFDIHRPLLLTGTLTRVEWVNPHAYIFVDVRATDGTVNNWALEMAAGVGGLRSAAAGGGGRGGLRVGDTVSVNGYMAKHGTHTGLVKELKLADGRTVTLGFADPYAR